MGAMEGQSLGPEEWVSLLCPAVTLPLLWLSICKQNILSSPVLLAHSSASLNPLQ